jgi:hypothetical protein
MYSAIPSDLRLQVLDQLHRERRREAAEARLVNLGRPAGRGRRQIETVRRQPSRPVAAAIVLAAITVLLGAAATRAAEPDVSRFEASGGEVFTDLCGPGVDLVGQFVMQGTVILTFDDAGDVLQERVHLDFFGTLTRSDTGRTISDPIHVTIVFDLVEGTRTETGLSIRRTYPGEGLFAHDVGRFVAVAATGEVVFLAGPHDVLLGGSSIPEVCAALA